MRRYLPWGLLWAQHQPAQPLIQAAEELRSQHLIHIHQGVRDVHSAMHHKTHTHTREDSDRYSYYVYIFKYACFVGYILKIINKNAIDVFLYHITSIS